MAPQRKTTQERRRNLLHYHNGVRTRPYSLYRTLGSPEQVAAAKLLQDRAARLDRSMRNIASSHQSNVVPFPPSPRTVNCLTKQDRQDVADLRSQAEAAGYDVLTIHVVTISESTGTTDYVAAYRAGESWSSWGFARDGHLIRSWNALTSRDSGTFPTMYDALGFILLGAATTRNAGVMPAV